MFSNSEGGGYKNFELCSTSYSKDSIKAIETHSQDNSQELVSFVDVLLNVNLDNDKEILSEFHAEANDHLDQVEAALLVLESDAKNTDSLSSVFRSFHTIKGVAGFLHLDPIQRLAHEVESLLDLARNNKITLDSDMISLILNSRDTIKKMVSQVGLALQKGILPSEIIPVAQLMQLVKIAAERGLNGVISNSNTINLSKKVEASTSKETATSIRVDTAKLDNLMNMVGELVITQSQLEEAFKRSPNQDSKTTRNLNQLTRITKELQHNSMALRMVPIKSTFQKIGRQVRELAKQVNKEVALHVSGEDTELDRNTVEKINDPLMHMIRNAIDHALESTEERKEIGKPPIGNIFLKAYHLGSNIVIEISDDGKGIDHNKILQKAQQKKLISEDKQYSIQEIINFIFLPGFSTAEKISDISGRGVGMDVVKRNIEELRGVVDIQTEINKGTSFKIKLPLTTAIIEGLVVKVGLERFIIPTTSVKVILRPQESQLVTVQESNEMISLPDKIVPIVRLHERFNITTSVSSLTEGTVIIIENFGKPYGLFVDGMANKQEVVIKNLGHISKQNTDLAGGAILGDGSAALILNTSSLASCLT